MILVHFKKSSSPLQETCFVVNVLFFQVAPLRCMLGTIGFMFEMYQSVGSSVKTIT